MKKCNCCGRPCVDSIKIRQGSMCNECRNLFPEGLRASLGTLNIKKIRELKKVFEKDADYKWTKCAALSNHFKIAADAILLDEKAVRFCNLEKVEVSLHPTESVGASRVKGIPVIRLFFKDTNAGVEYEMTEDPVIFGYVITGRSICYEPTATFRDVAEKINGAIRTGSSLSSYVNAVFEEARRKDEKARQEREKARQAEEKARQAERARQTEKARQAERARQSERARQTEKEKQAERARQAQEEEARREKAERDRRNKDEAGKNQGSADIDKEYLAFFHLTMPFTQEELKKTRNRLIKKYHPDMPGGSEEKCTYINVAYDRLCHLAG